MEGYTRSTLLDPAMQNINNQRLSGNIVKTLWEGSPAAAKAWLTAANSDTILAPWNHKMLK